MFFEPKIAMVNSENIISVSDKCKITGDFSQNSFWDITVSDMAREGGMISEIVIHNGFSDVVNNIIAENGEICGQMKEEYAICIGNKTEIYTADELGARNAILTLKHLADNDELKEGFIYDYPEKSFRAVKLFVPGRKQFDVFKKTIDLLAYYKNNVLVLEIGGAMEYKRRPEINIEWEKRMTAFKEKSPLLQSYLVDKHNYAIVAPQYYNGGSSWITQDEMKELINYCKERGIDIIPEVPSYSHCDYLVSAYPEIREVSMATEYSDVYCPSHPDTYKILFDVLDEIADVFGPKYIHIAHDELCVSDRCTRCQATGKTPAEIFADDVTKIYDYLAQKNIKTVMWSDVLMNHATGYGYNRKGDWDYVPPRFEARDMLPRDIIMMNWQWRVGKKHDDDLLDRGYKLTFGNLYPNSFDDWKGRASRDDVLGGVVSAWCPVEVERLRLFRVYTGLVYYAFLYWTKKFDNSRKYEIICKTNKEIFRYYNKHIEPKSENIIEITHALSGCTDSDFNVVSGHNGGSGLLLGYYIVQYDDGETAKIPVEYKKHITCLSLSKNYPNGTECTALEDITIDGKTFYKAIYNNPEPDKNIIGINFLKKSSIAFDLTIKGFMA